MQGPPYLHPREVLMTSQSTVAQELALRINGTVVALGAQYSELLHKMIFPRPLEGYERKDLIRYKRCLNDEEAYQVLLVFWKESRFVTDEVLRRVGLSRTFENGALNTWSLATSLATKIATSTAELAATNTRIRGIALAAEAFGLIDREVNRATKRPIQGTERLHLFMVSLGENQSRLLADLAPFLPSDCGQPLPRQ